MGKFIVTQVYLRKQEKSQINNVALYLKEQEKKQARIRDPKLNEYLGK